LRLHQIARRFCWLRSGLGTVWHPPHGHLLPVPRRIASRCRAPT